MKLYLDIVSAPRTVVFGSRSSFFIAEQFEQSLNQSPITELVLSIWFSNETCDLCQREYFENIASGRNCPSIFTRKF